MKAFRVAAVAIGLAFASVPASAAVLLNIDSGAGLDCAFGDPCAASASFDFKFPTFQYVQPMFGAAPTGVVNLPPRFTYRIVITASEAPLQTVAWTYPNYHSTDYIYLNGKPTPFGGEDDHNTSFANCTLTGPCTSYGYTHGNQSIFTFDDGLWVMDGISGGPYPDGTVTQLTAGWIGSVSVAAFFDPQYAGMPVNIQVFQFGAIPEPSTWAMLILGFGLSGAMLRRKRKTAIAAL